MTGVAAGGRLDEKRIVLLPSKVKLLIRAKPSKRWFNLRLSFRFRVSVGVNARVRVRVKS